MALFLVALPDRCEPQEVGREKMMHRRQDDLYLALDETLVVLFRYSIWGKVLLDFMHSSFNQYNDDLRSLDVMAWQLYYFII